MSNPLVELADVFFNGRSAPTAPKETIRIQLTRKHLKHLRDGETIRFTAQGTAVLVSLAAAPTPVVQDVTK